MTDPENDEVEIGEYDPETDDTSTRSPEDLTGDYDPETGEPTTTPPTGTLVVPPVTDPNEELTDDDFPEDEVTE